MWAYTLGVRFWEWLIRRAAAWHAGAAGRSNMLLDPWPENAENKDTAIICKNIIIVVSINVVSVSAE